MNMSEKVSTTKLQRSYDKISNDLLPDIHLEFTLKEYKGKHRNGKWISYPFVCNVCKTKFNRILQRNIFCPVCTTFTRPGRQLGWNKFIEEFTAIHGKKYKYPIKKPENFRGSRHILEIECPDHGLFKQKVSRHKNGSGCPKCANEKRRVGNEEFIKRSIKKHDGKYSYPNVEYTNQYEKVKIDCPKHGEVEQYAGHHMYTGVGCPKCAIGKQTSKAEKEVCDFVKSFNVEVVENDRDTINPYEIDILIPAINLGIEYCGLRTHSSFFGNKDKRYHLKKHELCEQKGIRLITVFEDEWRDKQEIVKSTLAHFLGCSPKGVYARNTTILEVSWATASEFLNKHHLLGAGQSGNYRIGAYHGDELISVMVFGYPSDERGRKDVVEMKRFVTNGKNNPGVGSKMFKHAIREKGYTSVVAFVDRRWFTGSFKSISGFIVDGATAPAKFWTNFVDRKHRRFKTKRSMLDSGEATNSLLTKEQMLNDIGYYSIYDCGKLRLQWDVNRDNSMETIRW